jgi:cytochrome c oxidase cbb3-type subunit 3
MNAASRTGWLAPLASLAALAALAGCVKSEGGSTTIGAPQVAASTDAVLALPLGDTAGAAGAQLATVANPYAGNHEAIQQGHDLFVRMNCAGCHGYDAKGAMGPNLTDSYWRYGGVPAAVFKSIYEGRPQGMPAWNPALPPADIWKLVSYIESLGGMQPASAYLASVQGDRPGDNVAPEVARTLPEAGRSQAPAPVSAASSAPEARPDAGGKP